MDPQDHDIRLRPTDQRGIDSGRTRWRVECYTCRTVIHKATTGPMENIAEHINDGKAAYERPMETEDVHH
jgi:hypothetical protein